MASFFSQLKSTSYGVGVCLPIAIVAILLAKQYQAPVMLFSLLIGLAMHFCYQHQCNQQGIDFCATTLLRIAVALLGVRIVVADIVDLGVVAPLLVVAALFLTICFSVVLAKLMKLPASFGLLSGGSVAVCGVSAAAAISTVMPKTAEQQKYFPLTVIAITTFSTLAMIFYPAIAKALMLPPELMGVFLGGTIHDVAQVVGAGYSVSQEVGDTATYIKLIRVALLMPIVMTIFLFYQGKQEHSGEQKATQFIPPFLIAFIIIATLKNFGLINQTVTEFSSQLSQFLLVVAMAAIGVRTSLAQIFNVGWKPIVLMASETAFIAAIVLLGIYCFY